MRTIRTAGGLLALVLVLAAGRANAGETADPRDGRVPLPAGNGWEAQLCLDRGSVGVWTVKAYPVLDSVGSDEIVALDDEGRLHLLVPYSGRWSGPTVLRDGQWLGGLCHGDVDPSVGGAEIYTGGARGDLWQVKAHPHGAVETRLVASLRGCEIHTMVVADVDRASAGPEIVVFTWPGGLYLVRAVDGRLRVDAAGDLDTRIRDAVLLTPAADGSPRIATVARSGALSILSFRDGRPQWTEIHRVKSGMGRIARSAPTATRPELLYTVCDDGRVYRYEARAGGWSHELIYAGPEGMRGVVSGSFDADPAVETIAVFGYSKKVELLRRVGEAWQAETIFEDREKGHWICMAEVDGRNSTPELFCCGYGGRLVMLSRPPGYGLEGVTAVRRDEQAALGSPPVRLGLAGVPRADGELSPLQYVGGFRLKTMVYETLVGVDAAGRVVPRLATALEATDDGRRWTFTLRDGARFHDGRPCDGPAVAAWFRSWLGKPEHGWLRMNDLVEEVAAPDAAHVVFRLKAPFPLPQELASVNPCAVGTPDRAANGTGPWRVESFDPRHGASLRRVADDALLEVAWLHGGDHVSRSHVEAIRSGVVDAVADGWVPHLPRQEAVALAAADDAIDLVRAPGTRTVFLACNVQRPGLADAAPRRALAAALDVASLVETTQHGLARPAHGLFGQGPEPEAAAAAVGSDPRPVLDLIVYEQDPDVVRLALALARQAGERGQVVQVAVLDRADYGKRLADGAWDLMVSGTHGTPYDPWVWLASRADAPDWLGGRVAEARTLPTEDARRAALARIEARLAEDARWIPLFVPERIGLVRAGRATLRFGATPYELEVAPR